MINRCGSVDNARSFQRSFAERPCRWHPRSNTYIWDGFCRGLYVWTYGPMYTRPFVPPPDIIFTTNICPVPQSVPVPCAGTTGLDGLDEKKKKKLTIHQYTPPLPFYQTSRRAADLYSITIFPEPNPISASRQYAFKSNGGLNARQHIDFCRANPEKKLPINSRDNFEKVDNGAVKHSSVFIYSTLALFQCRLKVMIFLFSFTVVYHCHSS